MFYGYYQSYHGRRSKQSFHGIDCPIQGLKKQLETSGVENEDLEKKYQEMVNEFGSLSDFDLDMKDTSWMPATIKKND